MHDILSRKKGILDKLNSQRKTRGNGRCLTLVPFFPWVRRGTSNLHPIYFLLILKVFLKYLNFFYIFYIFKSFWCVNVKIIFKKTTVIIFSNKLLVTRETLTVDLFINLKFHYYYYYYYYYYLKRQKSPLYFQQTRTFWEKERTFYCIEKYN